MEGKEEVRRKGEGPGKHGGEGAGEGGGEQEEGEKGLDNMERKEQERRRREVRGGGKDVDNMEGKEQVRRKGRGEGVKGLKTKCEIYSKWPHQEACLLVVGPYRFMASFAAAMRNGGVTGRG